MNPVIQEIFLKKWQNNDNTKTLSLFPDKDMMNYKSDKKEGKIIWKLIPHVFYIYKNKPYKSIGFECSNNKKFWYEL